MEAEALSDVSEKHGVPSVPFFLFFKVRQRASESATQMSRARHAADAALSLQGGAVVDRLEGADAPALSAKTAALCGAPRAPPPAPPAKARHTLIPCASFSCLTQRDTHAGRHQRAPGGAGA